MVRLSLVLAMAALAAAPARAADGSAIAAGGTAAGAPACSACHGADGAGDRGGGIPHLAGLPAPYLAHELASFADASRANDVMGPIASALTPDERAAVAAYYAGLPPAAPPADAATVPADAAAAARALALRGDWTEGLPACSACHGADGRGVGTAFPALAGQPAGYLSDQLGAWRSGKRRDDPLGLMAGVAGKLSPAEVHALAAYYAALPAAPGTPAGAGARP